ncbi:hypothetical protein GUH88_21150, partial [Xanthomonas citri pv. citri]|nr:hypothetical protein [Xanthomonas citri pv. citri]
LNWYHNFWGVLEDLTTVERRELFRPMNGVKWLRVKEYPRYRGLDNPYQPWSLVKNLFTSPTAPADLYLFLYASIDLLAER